MDLALSATPADYRKLEFLKRTFGSVLTELLTGNYLEQSRADAIPIVKAASEACIYDGEPGPVVRKYYAFMGDFSRVWFTLDLFNIMPDCVRTRRDRREAAFLVKQIAASLIGEVRWGLREELRM